MSFKYDGLEIDEGRNIRMDWNYVLKKTTYFLNKDIFSFLTNLLKLNTKISYLFFYFQKLTQSST